MTLRIWSAPDSGVTDENLPLWNMAMTYMDLPIALDDSRTTLRLSPIGAPRLTGPLHKLRTSDGEMIYIHIDAFPFQELLGVDFDIQAANHLPPALADAIHAGSVEFLLHKFPTILTAGMNYQKTVHDTTSETGDVKWFATALDGLAKTPVFLSIGAKTGDICAFLNGKLKQSNSALKQLRQTLDVAVYRIIGRASLRLDALRDLEKDDFIVLEDDAAHDLVIRCQDHIFDFETTEEGWLCRATRPLEAIREISEMSDTLSDPETPDAPPPDMAALVTTVLTFECGEKRVTLEELEGFQVGAIVTLPEQLTEDGVQVTVRAGEQTIALGDLVQVDERLAVRISRLMTRTS